MVTDNSPLWISLIGPGIFVQRITQLTFRRLL
jgi:hypothetical protein